ncbi:hypothetical protein P7K49_024419 [Saguinus oedipus]|uniref:Uncharacterized protein n=1 Tax=Saguinus oedipus TaxID=9490 RepID=A0ABQ9UPG6_SAGOE|nr:hypothetical protein P7K49_024419 [Saguinus oedipus]
MAPPPSPLAFCASQPGHAACAVGYIKPTAVQRCRAVRRAELGPPQLPTPTCGSAVGSRSLRLLFPPTWRCLAPHPRPPRVAPPPPALPRPVLAGVGVLSSGPHSHGVEPRAATSDPGPPSTALSPGLGKLAPAERARPQQQGVLCVRVSGCGGSCGSSAPRGPWPRPQRAALPGSARPGSCCPSLLLECCQRPVVGEVSRSRWECKAPGNWGDSSLEFLSKMKKEAWLLDGGAEAYTQPVRGEGEPRPQRWLLGATRTALGVAER